MVYLLDSFFFRHCNPTKKQSGSNLENKLFRKKIGCKIRYDQISYSVFCFLFFCPNKSSDLKTFQQDWKIFVNLIPAEDWMYSGWTAGTKCENVIAYLFSQTKSYFYSSADTWGTFFNLSAWICCSLCCSETVDIDMRIINKIKRWSPSKKLLLLYIQYFFICNLNFLI